MHITREILLKGINCTYYIVTHLIRHHIQVFLSIAGVQEYIHRYRTEIGLFDIENHQWRLVLDPLSQRMHLQGFHIDLWIRRIHRDNHYLRHITKNCECNKTDLSIETHYLRKLGMKSCR